MARKIYTQNVEVRFKAVDDTNEEFDVLMGNELVGSYNTQSNVLFVESVAVRGTLTGAVVGAVIRQFKRSVGPEVVH